MTETLVDKGQYIHSQTKCTDNNNKKLQEMIEKSVSQTCTFLFIESIKYHTKNVGIIIYVWTFDYANNFIIL